MSTCKVRRSIWARSVVAIIVSLALAASCQRQVALEPTATAEPTATLQPTMTQVPATRTPSATSLPTTATPSATATATVTPSQSPTATPTAEPTATATETARATAAATASPTRSPTQTMTLSPTATPTATDTPIPLPTPDGVYREAIVPILMYHYISDPPADADILRRDLSLAPDRFRAQLAYFREAGYTSITFYDLVMHLQIGQPLPPKPIMLTFDDGHKDHYTNAFPLLQEYGFVGTFFVITGFADEGRPENLSWQDVIEMAQAGMEIGIHSYTHPDLRGQPIDFVIWQSLGPKQAVESRIPQTVTSFCYPFGFYDDQVVAVIESAHYWTGVTTQQGVLHSSDRLFEIKRVRMRGADTVNDVVQRIAYLEYVDTVDKPSPTPSQEVSRPQGTATSSSSLPQAKMP